MSTRYPGLPKVAVAFWLRYPFVVFGVLIYIAFAGGLGAVGAFLIDPTVVALYAVGALSLSLHAAAMFLKDVRTEEYDPDQTNWTSGIQILLIMILMGTLYSTMLLIGASGAFIIAQYSGVSLELAAVFAAYYPVVDMSLMRRGHWTPSVVAFRIVAEIISLAFDIHNSLPDELPLVGKNLGPRF